MFQAREILGYTLLCEVFDITEEKALALYDEIKKHFKVISEFEHRYEKQGITKVAVLSESHLIIHTYPEINQCSIDIYSCSLSSISVFQKIIQQIRSEYKIDFQVLSRTKSGIKRF